jgi:hypothetical protein
MDNAPTVPRVNSVSSATRHVPTVHPILSRPSSPRPAHPVRLAISLMRYVSILILQICKVLNMGLNDAGLKRMHAEVYRWPILSPRTMWNLRRWIIKCCWRLVVSPMCGERALDCWWTVPTLRTWIFFDSCMFFHFSLFDRMTHSRPERTHRGVQAARLSALPAKSTTRTNVPTVLLANSAPVAIHPVPNVRQTLSPRRRQAAVLLADSTLPPSLAAVPVLPSA